MTWYQDATVTVHAGDCLDVLRKLPDASVDAVVTDPPYGLGFMGKEWDTIKQQASRPPSADAIDARFNNKFPRTGKGPAATAFDGIGFQAWCLEWTAECLRVLKPGGHLLAFGGTRTWHRLACAVEDAGFEVRDSIAWLYGSGFPKSLDVSKAIDKAAGAEREVVGRYVPPNGREWNLTADVARAQVGAVGHTSRADSLSVTAPATDAARTWQGWGTALKPAFEPIVVARKPLQGTVSANVLAHGTGALNVDGCRIGTTGGGNVCPGGTLCECVTAGVSYSPTKHSVRREGEFGRWPANVVLDESQAAALDEQSGEVGGNSTGPGGKARRAYTTNRSVYGEYAGETPFDYGDLGGASRFFYTAKAGTDERVRLDGIAHPTVKPLALMRWLVRLVTPPSVTVCEHCETMRYASTAPTGNAEALPALRDDVQGEGQPASAEVLLEGVRGRGDEGDASREGLRGVRADVHARPSGAAGSPVLLEGVREPGHSSDALDDARIREERGGLPVPASPGSPDGDEDGLRGRASSGGRRGSGADADGGRGRAPQERGQGRQPTGEPRGSAEADARQDPQAPAEADHLSALPREDRGLGSCPQCGGALTSRPGVVLEPFAGSGTTVEACILEGFQCVAIEREPDYLPLIRQRIDRRRDPVAAVRAAGEDGGLFALLDGDVA